MAMSQRFIAQILLPLAGVYKVSCFSLTVAHTSFNQLSSTSSGTARAH
jgi:hypothetical protein